MKGDSNQNLSGDEVYYYLSGNEVYFLVMKFASLSGNEIYLIIFFSNNMFFTNNAPRLAPWGT